ncbi:MAG: SurA N-terminal domain-containing protein [Pyrinomonadaceae bacterium]|nr:SurA N-terminal domain-containing protein [Pyrinomonadaceae bacterium]
MAVFAAFFSACGGPAANTGPGGDPNETAAKVNGKIITMQEVDRAVKAQSQGQESKLSPLELAGARLQVLQTLVEQEVMFQKAEKEGSVPSEDDITAEINKQKTASGKTTDQIEKSMKEQGMTEAALRDQVKKSIAIQKLVDKITGKIEPPKDSEVEAFYNGNKEAFVKKKGVKLAAIIIDPANSGEGDQTVDEASAVLRGNEIVKKLQAGQDFATVAREFSEDQSKFQGGDLGYLAEDDLKQAFPEQTVLGLMNPQSQIGGITSTRSQGKFFILKLQERSDKDEAVTLESPGVREQVQKSLVDNRKQLLAASYQAVAMNEAKIENFLAKKVVENPNELSGARPAGAANAAPAANANTAAPATTNTAANTNAAAPANKPADAKPADKPAANAAKPAANAPANK